MPRAQNNRVKGICSGAGVPARLPAVAGAAPPKYIAGWVFAASGGIAGRDAHATDVKKVGKSIHPIALAENPLDLDRPISTFPDHE